MVWRVGVVDGDSDMPVGNTGIVGYWVDLPGWRVDVLE